jgi:hypothetical protein
LSPLDTLQTLSEIGIAIAGFAGVIAALDRRTRDNWNDYDRGNLYTLLTWSIAAVFLAYVPVVLHGFGNRVAHPWRASHGIFAIYHSWVFFTAFRAMYTDPVWRGPLTLTLASIGLLVLSLEISSALGFAGTLAPTFYVIAVLWFLFLAATRFVVLATAYLLTPAAQQGVEPDVE